MSDGRIGYWTIDVPVSPEIVTTDMAVINSIEWPEEVSILDAKIVVHGRVWVWKRAPLTFGNQ